MNWITTINADLRELFKLEQGNEFPGLVKLATRAIKELKELEKIAGDDETLKDNIQECIEHFEFLKELADGTIPESKFSEYELSDKYSVIDLANGYIEEFFDVCDYEIKSGWKLCFVELPKSLNLATLN